MTQETQLQWGSHLPSLMWCLSTTVGNVIELGVGHFSTPVLHNFCEGQQRKLISLESDRAWFDSFSHYSSTYHQLYHVDYWQDVPDYAKERWSVALIDNSPGGERRAQDFKSFLPTAMFVLVHDYERENEEAIAPLLAGCHHHVSRRYLPPTLIASKTREIPSWL